MQQSAAAAEKSSMLLGLVALTLLVISLLHLNRHYTKIGSFHLFWRELCARLLALPAANLKLWPTVIVLLWLILPAMPIQFVSALSNSGTVSIPWHNLLLSQLTVNLLFLVTLWGTLRIDRQHWHTLVGNYQARTAGRALVRGFDGWLMLYAPLWAAGWLTMLLLNYLGWQPAEQDVLRILRDPQTPAALRGWMIGSAVLLAPVVEEALFRGLLLPALARHATPIRALLLSSLLFATMHMNAAALLPLLLLSFGCGLAMMASGNLLVPITIHALFNLFNLFAQRMAGG